MEFAEFILAHDGEDPGLLALSRDRFAGQVEDFELALNTLEARRKLRSKVPEWVALPQLRYPLRLSAEQCSSTETARYKASVALSACSLTPAPTKMAENAGTDVRNDAGADKKGQKCGCRGKLADLTGGLGVDSWVFSQVFEEVLYNEMRPELSDSARYNFGQLGADNITVRNCELKLGGLADVLDGFEPDVIFLDPARRASDGRKVFRLEDCQPDVLELLPELLEACPRLLLKLSPMADITLVCRQLQNVKSVHAVAAEGECKELLLLLETGYEGLYSTTIYESGFVMEIPGQAGNDEGLRPALSLDKAACLFEPGKALLKAGAFELPCAYGLEKLGQHTHLYVGETVPEELRPFGKVFEILEVTPLNNRSIKDVGKRYPLADVTARNIPITSDELRKRLGVRSGGSIHIFGVRMDALKDNFLIVVSV
jgi:hypothetical protein